MPGAGQANLTRLATNTDFEVGHGDYSRDLSEMSIARREISIRPTGMLRGVDEFASCPRVASTTAVPAAPPIAASVAGATATAKNATDDCASNRTGSDLRGILTARRFRHVGNRVCSHVFATAVDRRPRQILSCRRDRRRRNLTGSRRRVGRWPCRRRVTCCHCRAQHPAPQMERSRRPDRGNPP
jgi:hypothetical protein